MYVVKGHLIATKYTAILTCPLKDFHISICPLKAFSFLFTNQRLIQSRNNVNFWSHSKLSEEKMLPGPYTLALLSRNARDPEPN